MLLSCVRSVPSSVVVSFAKILLLTLYQSIKRLLDKPDMLQHYKKQAEIRGKDFSTVKTVQAVERLLLRLCEK